MNNSTFDVRVLGSVVPTYGVWDLLSKMDGPLIGKPVLSHNLSPQQAVIDFVQEHLEGHNVGIFVSMVNVRGIPTNFPCGFSCDDGIFALCSWFIDPKSWVEDLCINVAMGDEVDLERMLPTHCGISVMYSFLDSRFWHPIPERYDRPITG